MKNNRINLRLLCALSSIPLVSNGLQAMTSEAAVNQLNKSKQQIVKNVDYVLKNNKCLACDFKGVSLKNSNFKNTNLRMADFGCIKSDLEGADFEKANLIEANFEGANLRGARFEGANLWNTNFENSNLENTDFENSNLSEANLQGATGMTDQEVIDSGAELENTTLPSGKKYSK